MPDNFPYQLCEWQHKLSDLDSVTENLILYNEPYEIRHNNIKGKYTSSWEEYKYCWAVFTNGNGIFKEMNCRKNG